MDYDYTWYISSIRKIEKARRYFPDRVSSPQYSSSMINEDKVKDMEPKSVKTPEQEKIEAEMREARQAAFYKKLREEKAKEIKQKKEKDVKVSNGIAFTREDMKRVLNSPAALKKLSQNTKG
jgi:hypothetical protein